MNKVQKSLEELLIHPTNFEDVIIEKNSLDKMFTNYTKCCRDYEDSLSHQEEVEHGKMVEEYNSVCRNNEELDYRLEEWLKEVQEKPKVQIPEDFVHEKRATFRVEDHGCAKGNEFLNTKGYMNTLSKSQSNQGLIITPNVSITLVTSFKAKLDRCRRRRQRKRKKHWQ